jgi:hypothetical protein
MQQKRIGTRMTLMKRIYTEFCLWFSRVYPVEKSVNICLIRIIRVPINKKAVQKLNGS